MHRSTARWARCCAARGYTARILANWRRQREQGELVAGRARKRGPTPKPMDPRVKQLEAENRRLQRKLRAGGDDHHAPKKSCRDPGDPPETPRHRRDRLMVAIEAVDHDRRDRGAVSERRSRARHALSASTARPAVDADRPRGLAARAGAGRTPSGPRRLAQRAVRRSVAGGSPRHAARGADLSLLDADDVSHPGRRAAKSASGATRRGIRRTRSRSSWRRPRIRSGRGTSRS